MKNFIKAQRASRSVILLIIVLSFPLTGKAKSDADNELGPPAATPGHAQNQDPEKHLGTRGALVPLKPKSDAKEALEKPTDTAGNEQPDASKKQSDTQELR